MPGLWRVPLGGGSPTRVRGDLHARGLALSPDGKSAAVEFVDAATGRPHVGVLSLDGRDAPRPFARLSTPVRWTPDGRALVYADSQGGVGNLWRQPLTGGHPTRVTRFTSDLIYAFALSDNSDEIAISRGSVATDVVLISMR